MQHPTPDSIEKKMVDANEIATKLGLPLWSAVLLAVAVGAASVTAVVYEKVRIPGLEGRVALLERELVDEKLQTTRAQENAAAWKKFAEDLSSTAKAAADKSLNVCSTIELVRQLRADKSAVEASLGDVQAGHNNWNAVDSQERDKRVAELRRAASDYQAQILAVSQCAK